MRYQVILWSVILLAILLLLALLGALTVSSYAHGTSLENGVSIPSQALSGALDLGRGAVTRIDTYEAAEGASATVAMTTTYSATIVPGVPMVMGDTHTILEFAPGASGVVSVTLVTTRPQNPPPGGAIPRTWEITTTASSYEVTATFIYSHTVPDIVLVLDRSGSMEFDTLCYGCWEPVAGVPYSPTQPCRGGTCYPLPWDGRADGTPQHCGPTQRYEHDGHDYYFIEAEEYSYTNNTYNRDLHSVGYTYWVMQRSSDSASSRDGRGAYLMHMPYPDMETSSGLGVTCRYEEVAADVSPADGKADGKCWSGAPGGPYSAPRVDYDFTPLENRPGGYYIWVRGQSPGSWTRSDGLDTRIFWGIEGVLGGARHRSGDCGVGCEPDFPRGTGYDGAQNNWGWRRLNDNGPLYLVQSLNYTLNIWAGGAEFALDRIVITSNPGGYSDLTPLQENSGQGGAVWADGRSGWACSPCDARFGGYPADHPDRPAGFVPSDTVNYFPVCDMGPNPDRRTDHIYDDEWLIRPSVEAFKTFVSESIDPACDQIGYVPYSTDATIASELQCLRRLGPDECTRQVIASTVISSLDSTRAGGSTNIAAGMLKGLEVLGTANGHYGRPDAARVMILMTDGLANGVPNSECYSDPDRQWEDGAGTNAQDCVIYYAHEAREQGVVIHTITLGIGADFELMQAVADLTYGFHHNADRPEKLPRILEERPSLATPLPPGIGAVYRRAVPAGTWTMHPLTKTRIITFDLRDGYESRVITSGRAIAKGITSLSEWTLGYFPHHQVELEAVPGTVPADGVSTAILTATVTDIHGQPVPEGTAVTFTVSRGRLSPSCDDVPGTVVLPLGTNAGGIVTACLTTGLEPDTAIVTATAGGVSRTTSVEFESLRIELEAAPGTLPADGVSTAVLTATVRSVSGITVGEGTIVTFATSLGSVSAGGSGTLGSVSLPVPASPGGIVTALLTAGLEPGWAVVTASAGGQVGTAQVQIGSFLYLPTVLRNYAPTQQQQPAIIFDAGFDAGTEGFSYLDDTSRGTNQPTRADGAWLPSGGFSGGGLQVTLR